MSKNTIEGDFGPSLHIYGGVLIHNGHAILDGVHGYLDAGDYQGECFSGKLKGFLCGNRHFLSKFFGVLLTQGPSTLGPFLILIY